MNQTFKADYKRMTNTDWSYHPRKIIELLVRHQIRYMYHYRKYQEHHSPFHRISMFLITRKFGLEISPDATIGKGLYIGHPYNITIGSDVVLGEMVNIHKGCTIGGVNSGKKQGSPVIGNYVYIGINATVVGNIKIGDDVMICANTFVNFDVPSHSIVVSGGSSIHSREHATEAYIKE